MEFWGVTAQNEPEAGTEPGTSISLLYATHNTNIWPTSSMIFCQTGYLFNCMGWNAENQSIFVGENLGPTLANKGYGSVKIMIVDDQRNKLPAWVDTVCTNKCRWIKLPISLYT